VVEARPEGKTILESSPKESKGSNGVAERGIQEIEGQIRVMFLALQEKLGRKIDARERIVALIPEYASYLMNRLKKGEDGKVPYGRSRGKKPTVMGVEFGEKLLYKVPKAAKMEKLMPRWKHGIFVGVRRRSGELMVARPEGIIFVRAANTILSPAFIRPNSFGRPNKYYSFRPRHHQLSTPPPNPNKYSMLPPRH
jgi:hypothetical protein